MNILDNLLCEVSEHMLQGIKTLFKGMRKAYMVKKIL